MVGTATNIQKKVSLGGEEEPHTENMFSQSATLTRAPPPPLENPPPPLEHHLLL
jgi:hypothetical protein